MLLIAPFWPAPFLKDEGYDFAVMIQDRPYKGGDDYLPQHEAGAGVNVSSGGSLSDKD